MNNILFKYNLNFIELYILSPNIQNIIDQESDISVYVGFDPTADCLHVGHLLSIYTLSHLQKNGVRPIALVGGATGLIGDPSGRSDERPFLSEDVLQYNVRSIETLLKNLLGNDVKVVNNADWYKNMSSTQFLRDIGKHFRVGAMLAKESVKNRLDGEGLSFAELSYQLLQAYDFNYLFINENCKIQIGGSDQWGNITAGIEYIRKTQDKEAYGITIPLLTTAQGVKISKSMGNAVWLSEEKDSPFELYQFFMRLDDEDIEPMLKRMTFLSLDEIDSILNEHRKNPEKRIGHKVLASEVTKFVHGEESTNLAIATTNALYGEGNLISIVNTKDLIHHFEKSGRLIELNRSDVIGRNILTIASSANMASSKKELRRLLESGGIYLNNNQVRDNIIIEEKDVVANSLIFLRTGKKNVKVVNLR